MSFDVFLAHNSSDKAAVERLAKKLRDERGLTVWFDKWNLQPGLPWQELMEEGIRSSNAGAVVIGKDGLGPWEQKEMRALLSLAVETSVPVIPVLLPGASQPPEIPLFLHENTWVDLRDGLNPEGLDELFWGITGVQPPESTTPPADETAAEHRPRIAPSKLPRTGDVLIGREDELAILDEAWNNPQTCIVQIVAPGGVGKTQLVKKWREALLDRGEAPAEPQSDDDAAAQQELRPPESAGGRIRPLRAYDWSFYSQGTQQQASADDFFDRALRWFGEAEPENFKDPWAKGERLAELVRQQPTLLILDGMEPLQHPPGPMHGELTDPSIKALLEGLQRDNPGLCIVTTREAVPTLDEMSEPKRVTVDLRTLKPTAGAALLKHHEVHGDERELRQASLDVGGHALALILLGTYLKTKYGGDVRRRSEALLFQGHERYADHARKVMASYEAWLTEKRTLLTRIKRFIQRILGMQTRYTTGEAAVAILRLMGLFNRPADAGCLDALRAEPPIRGLTEALFVSGNDEERDDVWQRAIKPLRAAHLLADDEGNLMREREMETVGAESPSLTRRVMTQSLDAHPLVREHFAEQLSQNHPDASKEAHRRLYEHLQQSASPLPDNLNDMMPLFHAIAHACKSNCYQVAWDLFQKRIQREQENFHAWCLGAFGAELAALSHFFQEHWAIVRPDVPPLLKASVLRRTGYCQSSTGQLAAALEPLQLALDSHFGLAKLNDAADDAGLIVRIRRDLGQLSQALAMKHDSLELENVDIKGRHRVINQSRFADVLHQNGQLDEAEKWFTKAQTLYHSNELDDSERARAIQYCYGSMYRDLLMTRKDFDTAFSLATEAIPYNSGKGWLLEEGLARLTVQHVNFLRKETDSIDEQLQLAITLLRESGYQNHLPRGYLVRASLRRHRDDLNGAEEDIKVAQGIAIRQSLRLHHIDCLLEQAWLYIARRLKGDARNTVNEAEKMILKTKYFRRNEELTELRDAL